MELKHVSEVGCRQLGGNSTILYNCLVIRQNRAGPPLPSQRACWDKPVTPVGFRRLKWMFLWLCMFVIECEYEFIEGISDIWFDFYS